jgi:hypothetical protein
MRNEKLRLAKIARNKKRRQQIKKSGVHQRENPDERSNRLFKQYFTGSRHGLRKLKVSPQ